MDSDFSMREFLSEHDLYEVTSFHEKAPYAVLIGEGIIGFTG